MKFAPQCSPVVPPRAFACDASDEIIASLPTEFARRAAGYFRHDFSDVRVHVGPQPARLNCDALACGSDLYFDPTSYAPTSQVGAHALMHELAHLVQQREGRVVHAGPGIAFVNDPALEAEADHHAAAALAGAARPSFGPPWLRAPLGLVVQPIVTVGTVVYKKKGGAGNDAASLWNAVKDKLATVSKKNQALIKTKLEHWVNADRRGGMFGKGHNKTFLDYIELLKALVGQINSVESKALEHALAKKVQSSKFIRDKIRDYISGPLQRVQDYLTQNGGDNSELLRDTLDGGKDAARYAFYYSPLISGIAPGKKRSLYDAMKKFNKSAGTVSQMAAFVCDYSMVARELYSEQDYPFNLSQEDSRMENGGFNVNESSEWVRRARKAKVRLGAGASASTMQVLRVARALLGDGEDANTTMLCLALGLFAFWNLEMDKLKAYAEIHTFHEVMVVAYGYGVPAVPSLTGGPDKAAEFTYPLLRDIPA